MQSSRTFASFDYLKRGSFMVMISLSEEGWAFFWTLGRDMPVCLHKFD